jgi:hypothetical protein
MLETQLASILRINGSLSMFPFIASPASLFDLANLASPSIDR